MIILKLRLKEIAVFHFLVSKHFELEMHAKRGFRNNYNNFRTINSYS